MTDTPAAALRAHHHLHDVPYRVGESVVPLRTKVGVRGFPGVDPALLACADVLRRGRFVPRGRALDLTLTPGAFAAFTAAAGKEVDWTLAVTSAAAARTLPQGATWRVAHAWDVERVWGASAAFDTVVWRPPADRGVARVGAELAAVARLVAPAGEVLLMQHKDEGAQRTERLAAAYFGAVETIGRDAGWRFTLLREPRPGLVPDPWVSWDVPGGAAHALVGTFAAGKVDAGTDALLRARARAGAIDGRRVLDLGCGTGLLARAAAQAGATAVVAVDDDAAAVASTARNLAAFPHARALHADLLAPLALGGSEAPFPEGWTEAPFHEVWCNPPFHVGRQVEGALSRAFVAAAITAIERDGAAWFVVNRALGYARLFAEWDLPALDVTPDGVAAYTVWRVGQPTNS